LEQTTGNLGQGKWAEVWKTENVGSASINPDCLAEFFWDYKGYITEANDKFPDMVGYDRSDCNSFSPNGLIAPQLRGKS